MGPRQREEPTDSEQLPDNCRLHLGVVGGFRALVVQTDVPVIVM